MTFSAPSLLYGKFGRQEETDIVAKTKLEGGVGGKLLLLLQKNIKFYLFHRSSFRTSKSIQKFSKSVKYFMEIGIEIWSLSLPSIAKLYVRLESIRKVRRFYFNILPQVH